MLEIPLEPTLDPHFRPGLGESEKAELLAQLRLLISSARTDSFDEITRLVARALEVPVALVSFVTDVEQVFVGLDGTLPEPWQSRRATALSHSFCQHVANSGQPLVVSDAREHPLVRENPAIADLGIIAYLGVPLRTASGSVLGSLCAIDQQPRQWTGRDLETLRGLSGLLMVEIELRLTRSQLQTTLKALQNIESHRSDRTRLLVHDLRTPLNSLLLGLRSIPLLGDLNPDQAEALEMGLRGGQTLVSLVDDMLDTAAADERGAESLRITRGVDPAGLLSEAMTQVSSMATPRRVSLRVEKRSPHGEGTGLPADSVGSLDLDVDKIVRALVNLLSNAIKFTPAGGSVTLSLRGTVDAAGERQAVFAVRDTGRGISPEDQARLFQRFDPLEEKRHDYTTQRSSGLGLFFVKAVVEAHGGTVQVESEPGKGSTFAILLPCQQPLG